MSALTLDEQDANTLGALLTALDEVGGIWPQIEAAMIEAGIPEPEAAMERLREKAGG